jgi:hypothetical protein
MNAQSPPEFDTSSVVFDTSCVVFDTSSVVFDTSCVVADTSCVVCGEKRHQQAGFIRVHKFSGSKT